MESLTHKMRNWFIKEERELKEGILSMFRHNNHGDEMIENLTIDDLHHPKVQATLRKYMDKLGGFVLIGPLHMGTPYQQMEVIYDTGSSWTTIEDIGCTSCLNNTYNTTASSSYSRLSSTLKELTYGSAQLYGYSS